MVETKESAMLKLIGIDPAIIEKEDTVGAYSTLLRLEEAMKVLDSFKATLKEKLFLLAEKYGEKEDSGSYVVKLPGGGGWKKEARTSVSTNLEKVKSLAEKYGLNNLLLEERLSLVDDYKEEALALVAEKMPDAVETETVVSEEGLAKAYEMGKITDEDLASVVSKKIIYALVKVK